MKRQGMKVTIGQLRRIADELEEQLKETYKISNCSYPTFAAVHQQLYQINIINRTPECSDTWEIEDIKTNKLMWHQVESNKQMVKRIKTNDQRKKDKDDGSNVSLSGTPKQSSRKTNKDEHMSKSVDKHVDTDALRKTSNEATPNDGRRLKSNKSDVEDS